MLSKARGRLPISGKFFSPAVMAEASLWKFVKLHV